MVVGIVEGFDASECGSNEYPKATSNGITWFHYFLYNNENKRIQMN